MGQLTPMLKQYSEIKSAYPDAILFFRMGDFYEMFFEDARVAARILRITLTARGTFQGEKVPMCGVPHHASKAYIGKLVQNGWKVAICEQTGDPKTSKGIVSRDVIRVVTPGSIVDEGDVDDKSNLYMAALSRGPEPEKGRTEAEKVHAARGYGLAHLDLSTGEFCMTEVDSWDEIVNELGRVNPAEVLVHAATERRAREILASYRIEPVSREAFEREEAERVLREQLDPGFFSELENMEMPEATIAAGVLVRYLRDIQKGALAHIRRISPYRTGSFMILDEATCSHLELLKTMRRQSVKGSLFDTLNRTVTPMGSRLLKKWILYPLVSLDEIHMRLAAVSCLKEAPMLREEIGEHLQEVYDLERLNGRLAMGRANARDLLALKASLLRIPRIKDLLLGSPSRLLSDMGERMDPLKEVTQLIEATIHEDPPVAVKEGGIIKEGYDEDLDRLISLSRDGKGWITRFAETERKRTGISSLKVGFNKVFGYYIEISKANLHLAPPEYIRKQTLVNGERYITEALKQMEDQVLGAEEKRVALEYEIFQRIVRKIARENESIQETAQLLARTDVIAGLALTSELNDYVRPEVNDDMIINIRDGRHPVIEKSVRSEEFVPNDIYLDDQEQQLLIITGPNMAGKSTVLRQTALSVIMAQMGCFVPASGAVIGLVDRVFTRVGASDDLARGESTFMVEMKETANILRNAGPRSLVILDEIGRGTSTFDGLSIAWAVAEALHDRLGKGVRTLFATHYHELTELAATKARVKNFNIAVREWNDRIIFLRKILPGGTSRSYGIQVARIAGLPEPVLSRAREILENLEAPELDELGRPRLAHTANDDCEETVQLGLFGFGEDRRLRSWIRSLDISSMTPLDALVELNKLSEYVADTGHSET